MINSSAEYKAAITADARRTLLKAAIDIIDPDIVYGETGYSEIASFAKPAQLLNKKWKSNTNYVTLEHNRWLLDGDSSLIPEDPQQLVGEVGYISDSLSGEDGSFENPPWVEIRFANVSILQAFSVYFSDDPLDDVAADFTVEVKSGDTAFYTLDVTGNAATKRSFEGFTVNYPDAIRITITKWSIPYRRARIPELIPGIYEEWDNDILVAFDVVQQSDISNLSLRYGTATLRMDNESRRFEPRSKTGIFRSIEERQGIDLNIGVRLSNGEEEFKKAGIYYQHSGGWKTGDNGLSMTWRLVDIVGLVSKREFIPPAILPVTLKGWIAAIVAQLGENFRNRYHVDPDYAAAEVTADDVAHVSGRSCGDILRFACMASGTWPRADSETGKLTAEPLWSEGNKLDLDNMSSYPVIKANEDIAALTFKLYDEDNTQLVIIGTSATADRTASIDNPFIHTEAAALQAAKNILRAYGGNQIETVSRGDPAGEIGDVDTVWLDESSAATGRRIYQTFTIKNGVLADCKSTLLQADGAFLYENFELVSASGVWTVPENVTSLRVIIGGGGSGGTRGKAGTFEAPGKDGEPGSGGKVWYGTIDVEPGQSFDVVIGAGGAEACEGENSSFGILSSAEGRVYENGFTDVSNGASYGRTGVTVPLPNSSDGGAGGKGGYKGVQHEGLIKSPVLRPDDYPGFIPPDGLSYWPDGEKVQWVDVPGTVTDVRPGIGGTGTPGASGFVAIYWDKEATT